MADSEEVPQSVITAAMAFRAKYRKVHNCSAQVQKLKLRIEQLGVHPENRAGVYPGGVRCKNLCERVFDIGFSKEEFSTNAVVVEEAPPDEVRSRGGNYVSGSKYNRAASKKDELLVTCFDEPFHDVRHMLLCHNHMMVILRAFLTRAKWDISPNEKKKIIFCDSKGHLCRTAVAASENGKQAEEVLLDGFECEVLSWRMDSEQPDAASIISQALNKGNEIAMRTTELTAIAHLKGEIMTQMSKNVGQVVAFKSVQDCKREYAFNSIVLQMIPIYQSCLTS